MGISKGYKVPRYDYNGIEIASQHLASGHRRESGAHSRDEELELGSHILTDNVIAINNKALHNQLA